MRDNSATPSHLPGDALMFDLEDSVAFCVKTPRRMVTALTSLLAILKPFVRVNAGFEWVLATWVSVVLDECGRCASAENNYHRRDVLDIEKRSAYRKKPVVIRPGTGLLAAIESPWHYPRGNRSRFENV